MNNIGASSYPAANDRLLGGAHSDGQAVIYLRVSSTRQVERDHDQEGISIPAQREACRRKAEQLGLTIVNEYVEPGRSALEMSKRAAFQRMLTRIRDTSDIDHVIVYKLSRMARNRVVLASSGIEPLFRLSDDLPGHQRAGVVAALKAAARTDVLGFVSTHGRLPADPALPERLRAVLATATQISPAGHLAVAAAVQACVDEAVSKTVNLPSSARSIEVYDVYATAFELGCKGITVYVDGSRSGQPQALATATAS